MHGFGSVFRPVSVRRLRGLALLALLLLGGAASWTQAEPPAESKEKAALALDQQLLATAKKDSEIMANLTYLSDRIGPRLTGSEALKKANLWTAEKMKGYGLTNVHLEGWMIPLGWERGTATARLLEPDHGPALSLAAVGWTPGTNGKLVADVVVLNAKNSRDLLAYKGKLKNAIVLQGAPATVRPILDPPPPPRIRTGQPPAETIPEKKPEPEKLPEKSVEPPLEKKQTYQQIQAFRRELTEFLRVEGAAVLLMDAGKPHGLLTTTGGWQGPDRASGAEPLPSAYVIHEHYALLHRLATRPEPARTRLEIEIANKMIDGPLAVYNTVGEIKGSEKPDEYVILGAHLDSWDLGQGTTDNGTGSSIILETARLLARGGYQPKRTIRFVLFTGEEQGLHGSRAYVEKHREEMARVSMCLVHDTGTGKVIGLGLQGRAAIKPVLEPELISLKDIGFKDVNLRSLAGSDHASFEQAGVPGFAAQQDMSEYRLTHHSQSDTLDKAREPDLIQGAQVLAVTALRVANLPALLPRDKKLAELPETEKKPVMP